MVSGRFVPDLADSTMEKEGLISKRVMGTGTVDRLWQEHPIEKEQLVLLIGWGEDQAGLFL